VRRIAGFVTAALCAVGVAGYRFERRGVSAASVLQRGVRAVRDAGPDQIVVGDLVVLDGSDSRAGAGSIQSYSWAQTSSPSVTLDADRAQAQFMAPDVGASAVLTFRLTVVDGANAADSDNTGNGSAGCCRDGRNAPVRWGVAPAGAVVQDDRLSVPPCAAA
jgi:hypothetical protein